jgi:cysteine desulfurase
MMKIYFDNAASTKVANDVIAEMSPYFVNMYGNPSSIHSIGKPLKVIIEESRDEIADFLSVKPKEIIFTSGGTESNNFSIKGLAFRYLGSNKNHIITSSIEHPAVSDTIAYLQDKFGFNVTIVKPDKRGRIIKDDVLNEILPETFLISIMHSNNETGIINEIEGISGNIDHDKIFLHSDTVQSIGKTKFYPKELNIDFATLSAHKIYGPKGIGILYVKDGVKIDKYIHGGGQERNMRGGTENVAGIVGLKKAVELLKFNMKNDIEHYEKLNSYLRRCLIEEFGDSILFNSLKDKSLPNILNFSFDVNKVSVIEDMLLIQLDMKGIETSGGSACSSGSLKPSKILLELGRGERTAMASLRISFGRENKMEEIDILMNALKELVKFK